MSGQDLTSQSPTASSLRSPLLWFGMLLVGSILRVVGLDAESLWLDEGFTLHCATAPDVWEALSQEGNPPLFFVCLRGWIELFGLQPAALRSLSVVASIAALCLFATGLRRANMPGTSATLTLALYASSPFLCWYAHELRPYAFLELGTVAMFTGWQFARHDRYRLGCVLATFGAALACWSHYFGVPAAGAIVMLAWFDPPRTRPRWLLPVLVLVGVASTYPAYAHYLPIQGDHEWGAQSHLGYLYLASLPLRLFVAQGGELPTAVVVAVAAVMTSLILITLKNLWQRQCAGWGRTVAFGVFVPFAGVLAANVLVEPRFTARYFIMATPYLALFMGMAAVQWPARRANAAALVVMAVFATSTLSSLQLQVNDGYREACASVREHWRQGDRIGTLTGMPLGYCSGPLHAYLTPQMLENGFDESHETRAEVAPSSGGRLHLIVRSMSYLEEQQSRHISALPVIHTSPTVNRVRHLVIEWQ